MPSRRESYGEKNARKETASGGGRQTPAVQFKRAHLEGRANPGVTGRDQTGWQTPDEGRRRVSALETPVLREIPRGDATQGGGWGRDCRSSEEGAGKPWPHQKGVYSLWDSHLLGTKVQSRASSQAPSWETEVPSRVDSARWPGPSSQLSHLERLPERATSQLNPGSPWPAKAGA